jgi:hypothetical protein
VGGSKKGCRSDHAAENSIGFGPLVSPSMVISANVGRLGPPGRVTLEAAVPAVAREGEAWAAMASAWTPAAVRAALRWVA